MNDIHKKTAVWTSLYYGDIKVGGRGEGGEKAGRGKGGEKAGRGPGSYGRRCMSRSSPSKLSDSQLRANRPPDPPSDLPLDLSLCQSIPAACCLTPPRCSTSRASWLWEGWCSSMPCPEGHRCPYLYLSAFSSTHRMYGTGASLFQCNHCSICIDPLYLPLCTRLCN